jgi:hypothetical protein
VETQRHRKEETLLKEGTMALFEIKERLFLLEEPVLLEVLIQIVSELLSQKSRVFGEEYVRKR